MLEKLKEIVREQLGSPASELDFETKTLEDLGADSLDIVELSLRFEDEFSITVSDEEIFKMEKMSIVDLAAHLETMKK